MLTLLLLVPLLLFARYYHCHHRHPAHQQPVRPSAYGCLDGACCSGASVHPPGRSGHGVQEAEGELPLQENPKGVQFRV